MLAAEALDVADVGRAVPAGTKVWRGSMADRTKATGGRHQAAAGGTGGLLLLLHPESGFHGRAWPAKQQTQHRLGFPLSPVQK